MRLTILSRVLSICLLFLSLIPALAQGPDLKPAPPAAAKPPWPVYTLTTFQYWHLNPPRRERFDGSALLASNGVIHAVSDRGPAIHQVRISTRPHEADLIPLTNLFTVSQLRGLAPEKSGRYDSEGLTMDTSGRMYLSEETDRWILRWDPRTDQVERLPIDWTPVLKHFSASDRNASFEGIAMGADRLYVANERQSGRIFALETQTWRIVDDFVVYSRFGPARDVHYSDLSWFNGSLFVLLRQSQSILEVDPKTHKVLKEWDFRRVEWSPNVAYQTFLPFGLMEGLAVDAEAFWLLADNNGLHRAKDQADFRPVLFRCERPDLSRSDSSP